MIGGGINMDVEIPKYECVGICGTEHWQSLKHFREKGGMRFGGPVDEEHCH